MFVYFISIPDSYRLKNCNVSFPSKVSRSCRARNMSSSRERREAAISQALVAKIFRYLVTSQFNEAAPESLEIGEVAQK